jgi:hypothetical protein
VSKQPLDFSNQEMPPFSTACPKTAFREAADRLDGKVPHAVVGDDEHPPVTEPPTSDLDLARAVAFILRKGMADAGTS